MLPRVRSTCLAWIVGQFRTSARLNFFPPGEIGAEECAYIGPAPLAGSSDLECLPYQGRECIRDFSAGGMLSPSVFDLSGPRGPYVTDDPVGHTGTLSLSTFMPEILVDPGGTLPPSDLAGMLPVGPVGRWGTWPLSVSDPTGPGGQSVTDGPVGHLGTLPLSTFEPAILLDLGGTSPSSDLAGMLLPAIPINPVGFWGTLSSSDYDPVGQDGPYGADGPVGHLGTLYPSTSTYEILEDPGGMSPSSDLAWMRDRHLQWSRKFGEAPLALRCRQKR